MEPHMATPIRLTPAELAEFRAALIGAFGPLTGRPGPGQGSALDRFTEIQAGQDRDYAGKMRRWEADAPLRARAEQAMRLGHARRAAATGHVPGFAAGRVFNALWADQPVRPVMF
jgi:hypothetical protein